MMPRRWPVKFWNGFDQLIHKGELDDAQLEILKAKEVDPRNVYVFALEERISVLKAACIASEKTQHTDETKIFVYHRTCFILKQRFRRSRIHPNPNLHCSFFIASFANRFPQYDFIIFNCSCRKITREIRRTIFWSIRRLGILPTSSYLCLERRSFDRNRRKTIKRTPNSIWYYESRFWKDRNNVKHECLSECIVTNALRQFDDGIRFHVYRWMQRTFKSPTKNTDMFDAMTNTIRHKGGIRCSYRSTTRGF